MVKVAVVGGSGNVGQEIVDALVATGKHEISILSRKPTQPEPPATLPKGVIWAHTTYTSVSELVNIFKGVETAISFVSEMDEPEAPVHKNLIDACIQAGVKRFAPSQWAKAGSAKYMTWYAYKDSAVHYLEQVNKDKKVLEYTLFQPGLFTNYFARPHKSSPHLHLMQIPIDFLNKRALLLQNSEHDTMSLTTIEDVARIVAKAIKYPGEWPKIGGIRGCNVTVQELIEIGERVRGCPFTIEHISPSSAQTGTWDASWVPQFDHPSIPADKVDAFSKPGTGSFLLEVHAGFVVSDEWNRVFPEFEFEGAREYLEGMWEGKG